MQAFEAVHGSLEASYRPYHDDWDIWSHTLSLTWFQKLGSRVTLAPTFSVLLPDRGEILRAGVRRSVLRYLLPGRAGGLRQRHVGGGLADEACRSGPGGRGQVPES